MPYRERSNVDARLPPDRRRRVMLLQVAGGLVAGAMLMAGIQLFARWRASAAPPSTAEGTRGPSIDMEGTRWAGTMGGRYSFTLAIESVRGDAVEGRMEWPGWGVTKVRGTMHGQHLELVDYALISGSMQLGDKKDLIVDGDTMDGTDKNGATAMHAVRIDPR